jgi:hypothetical protein
MVADFASFYRRQFKPLICQAGTAYSIRKLFPDSWLVVIKGPTKEAGGATNVRIFTIAIAYKTLYLDRSKARLLWPYKTYQVFTIGAVFIELLLHSTLKVDADCP